MTVKQPEAGVGRAKTDNCIAAGRNDDDVTHGRVNKVQGRFTTSAPSWFRAESVGAVDVCVWADETSRGAVELSGSPWPARRSCGRACVLGDASKSFRVDRVVVGEHHLDGFIVR